MDILLPDLKADVLKSLKQPNPEKKIDQCFRQYEKIFDYVDTEHKIFTLLKSRGYIEHELICVGTTLHEKLVGNEEKLVLKDIFEAYVPLRESLKSFLQIPGMFNKIENYIDLLQTDNSGIINNIMQSSIWKKMVSESSDIVLPLFLYYDEFEAGNPPGTHAGVNKFGAIYTIIGCLPPEISSRLSSIIFTGLICASEKKDCSNDKVFGELIRELNFLRREGMKILVNGKSFIVKFQLALVLGDNLGLNEIFDMTESFKDSAFCRVCRAEPEVWKYLTREDVSLLRNKENYLQDIMMNDSQKYGIVKNSAFNSIDNFHVLDNVSFDIMHDILHGVANYVLRAVIYDLIFVKNYNLTLQTVNLLIQDFNYDSNVDFNKPPEFHFNSTKNKVFLKCSASEILTLLRYFGLMLGDYIKNRDDDSWRLYLYLRKIVDIIMSPRVEPEWVDELNDLVHKHNSLYIRLFGALKPKFHYLVHYGRYLLINGPLVNYWCMRFESRHRQLKSVATAISSTVNLVVSIAIKQTLKMYYFMHSFRFNIDTISEFEIEKDVKYYEKIEIDSLFYRKGTMVIIDNTQMDIIFGEITAIYEKNGQLFFVLRQYQEHVFDSHYYAYQVVKTGRKVTMKHEDLPKFPPCFFVKNKNKCHYVITHFKM